MEREKMLCAGLMSPHGILKPHPRSDNPKAGVPILPSLPFEALLSCSRTANVAGTLRVP